MFWVNLVVLFAIYVRIEAAADYSNLIDLGNKHFLQDSDEWDHFVYAQQWPPSVCVNPEEHQCDIGTNVTSWTVHGLWPNQGSELAPCYCNSSWHFNPEQLQSILGDLMAHWPNLYISTPSSKYDFWKHEWVKHGTCASSKPELHSELKYFQMGLKLQQTINIASAFEKHGIKPKNESAYSVKDVENALVDFFGNESVSIECEYTGNPKQQYLKQIEVCLDKATYKPIPCAKSNNIPVPGLKKSCKYFDNAREVAQKEWFEDPELVQKCAGDPNYCKCSDKIFLPEFHIGAIKPIARN